MRTYARQVGSPMRGTSNAGWAPRRACTTKAPMIGREEHRAEQAAVQILQNFLEDESDGGERRIECGRKPGRRASRGRGAFLLLGHADQPATVEATLPPSCTLGPSRPRLWPPPMLKALAMNFTQASPAGVWPKSFQKASLSCGTPLPAASGAECRQQPPREQRNAGDDGRG